MELQLECLWNLQQAQMLIIRQSVVAVYVHILIILNISLIQNSQAVKKESGPQKCYGEKRCEIQGGSQEMAVMVGLI